MAEAWTCDDCGSATTTRKIDVTSAGDAVKQFITAPYVCSNSKCYNRDKKNHSLQWCTEV